MGRLAASRAWVICGLLLIASAINYMDRQTLANAATRITREFALSNEQYGHFESAFGWSFAAGSLLFGFLADVLPLRWLYPTVLLLWSAVGVATGYAQNYEQFLACRALLGLFEAGHWPCGVKATRILLSADARALGNGVLQSGTSIGAIVTPLIMRAMLTDEPGSWRFVFQAVGLVGSLWIVAWLLVVRRTDFATERSATAPEENRLPANLDGPRRRGFDWRLFVSRRMLLMLVTITLINTSWQLMRAWLPKFLQEGRGYAESQTLLFNSLWYAVTDVGCLGAGAWTVFLVRRGRTVTRARLATFLLCAVACASLATLPWLAAGSWLLVVLLLAGAGALGLFPLYHAFTQDISGQHQGRVTGIASAVGWLLPSLAQTWFGRWVDQTSSFDQGLVLVSCLPLVAFAILALFWPVPKEDHGSSP